LLAFFYAHDPRFPRVSWLAPLSVAPPLFLFCWLM
jgi:hypothetical protein